LEEDVVDGVGGALFGEMKLLESCAQLGSHVDSSLEGMLGSDSYQKGVWVK